MRVGQASGVVDIDVIQTLQDWERRFPVATWKVHGIHVWPLIRVKMGSKLNAASTHRALRRRPPALRPAVDQARSTLRIVSNALPSSPSSRIAPPRILWSYRPAATSTAASPSRPSRFRAGRNSPPLPSRWSA